MTIQTLLGLFWDQQALELQATIIFKMHFFILMHALEQCGIRISCICHKLCIHESLVCLYINSCISSIKPIKRYRRRQTESPNQIRNKNKLKEIIENIPDRLLYDVSRMENPEVCVKLEDRLLHVQRVPRVVVYKRTGCLYLDI